MRAEAIALYKAWQAKVEREKQHFDALMQFAVEVNTPDAVYEQLYDRLKMDLLASGQFAVGEGVNFDPGAKPFIQ